MDPNTEQQSRTRSSGQAKARTQAGGNSSVKKYSREELNSMHPHDLLKILDDNGIDHRGYVEKGELIDLIMGNKHF
ncbi:hypothetical protein BGZ73_001320 [Actinomortierella ambigua]|nr:hypothetical protein BGZ73_001320 [Actinomortierella ambigua]